VALSTTRRERSELTPERWKLISRIFKSAISLDDEARVRYVAGQCGADESLRAEVEKLIDSHQRASAEEFIAGVAAEDNAGLLIDNQELSEQQSHRLTKGQQLGAYVILDVLGEGGMGEVYLAKDTRLDRTVALKVLSEEISADRRRMQRFRQEARIASSLNQPNILTIYEFGDVGSLTFLATEFVDGDTLRHYIRNTRLKLPEILDISIQMLAALDVAHEAGIVHRDIKPENVMIRRRDNVVKVLDFGLAKLTEKGATSTSAGSGSGDDMPTEVKTVPGTLMGTVNYMSPEQTQAHKVDERTDIWSTGAIIHEMVTRTLPFKGTTTSHTIVQILEKDLVPLSQLAKEPVPPELERIVSKALSKNPDERYQTAKDMLIDLRSLRKRIDVEAEIGRSSSPTTSREAVAVKKTDDRSKQKRVVAITLIGMLIVAAVFFGISVWRASRARQGTPPAVPAEERTLAYWVTVQKFRDGKPYQEPFILASEINFELDYHIRINVRSAQSGHLYILNEGPATEPEYVVLFPSSTANNGSALLKSEQLVQIPEETWFKFDAEQGVEKVWFVFASEAIADLEALKRFANKTDRGLIADVNQRTAVREFLSKHAAPAPKSEKQEKQTVVTTPGKVLVHSIKLEHH
jgi:serine/threonine protein kinase